MDPLTRLTPARQEQRLLLPPPNRATEPARIIPRPLSRILFADNEPNIVRAYELVMESWSRGRRRTVYIGKVNNGQDALEQFQLAIERGEPFDCTFTDVNMPKLRGDELAKRISEIVPTTFICIATGNLDEFERLQKLEGNGIFYRVLYKPLDIAVLREIFDSVDSLLQQAS